MPTKQTCVCVTYAPAGEKQRPLVMGYSEGHIPWPGPGLQEPRLSTSREQAA